jgi:putative (di)nucleoside polyphosphate hydrolase
MEKMEFLITEYKAFTESFWKNEEVGERRVDFFLTISSAILTAVILLTTSEHVGLSRGEVKLIATSALLGTFLFGLLFFIRMLHRNKVTDEYKEILKYLRFQMCSKDPSLHAYHLPFKKHKRLLKGGLTDTMALMNSILISVIIALWFGNSLGWIWPICSFMVFFIAQVWYAKYDRERGKDQRVNIPNSFRVGVGAVIIDEDGKMLACERNDIHGSWQFPQGGKMPSEDFLEAVYREINEETGIKGRDLKLIHSVSRFLAYEIPTGDRSEKTGMGQVQRWFFFRFSGEDKSITLGDQEEFRAWNWLTMEEVLDRVVYFKREMYQQIAEILTEVLDQTS